MPVNSIKFLDSTEDEKMESPNNFGYVNKRIQEPYKKDSRFSKPYKRHRESDEEFQKRMDDYEKDQHEKDKKYRREKYYYDKHKGEYQNPVLAKNLVNREIKFCDNKINIIFGPNASGKTTILTAIAGQAGIQTHGFPSPYCPTDVRVGSIFDPLPEDEKSSFLEGVKICLNKASKNPVSLDWTGNPVFYYNIANKLDTGIGSLVGDIFGSDMDEFVWRLNKNKISDGQKTGYLFQKLFKVVKDKRCYDDFYTVLDANDVWQNCFAAQLEYFHNHYPRSSEKQNVTLLMDEIDKSMDIPNVICIYKDVLPQIVKGTGVQIITVSHNPIVLSKMIRENENYNIISMNEEYTNECINKLNELF